MGCGRSSEAKVADSVSPPRKRGKSADDEDYKQVHSACRWNTQSIDEIKKLLRDPKRVNCIDPGNGNTPLHIASQNGHSEIVKLLLSLKASIDSQNASGNTPLHMSIEYDYYETSKLLVEAGANLDANNLKDCPAKRGIEGSKHWLFMPLLNAKDAADVTNVLKVCELNISELEKSAFAGMGLRTKKALGPGIWTDEVQEVFKSILRQIK